MNSSSSGKRLEGFLSGKGFYIVLFLCAAVIGVSAWMMAAGNETMQEDVLQTSVSSDNRRVETVIIPAQPEREPVVVAEPEEEAPALSEAGLEPAAPAENTPDEAAEAAAPVFLWPVTGQLSREHSGDRLVYDETMRDWRTHEGVDILAEPGTAVLAASAGTVESVRTDDMFGTVITISHGNGSETVYANLQEDPPVREGQWVDAGQQIGTVGRSALCEVAQEDHLHFALLVDGSPVDPLTVLAG